MTAAPIEPVRCTGGHARATGLTLTLLNTFELKHHGEPVALPASVERLVAFLAIRDHPMRRIYVSGMLWTAFPEERAAANLRSSLWRVHQRGYRIVDATNQQLRLDPAVEVDLREVGALAHRLIDGSAEAGDLDVGSATLAGELLPDWYDDWVLIERERFRQLSLHALEALSARLTAQGRYGEALEVGVAAVAGEPLRESAHRVVIRAHLAEGNSFEAVRQYRLCRRLLGEIGLAPSPQLTELVRGLTV
jgi:DNA-binding SARP family transcriptional activator